METNLLRTFVTVAQHRHLTRGDNRVL